MPFRAHANEQRPRHRRLRLRRWILLQTLPYPNRFRWAVRLGRLATRLPALVPPSMRPMLELLPEQLPKSTALPALTPAHGPRRARVALLTGCAQQVLEPDIDHATINLLSRNGVEVLCPPNQGCCGALAWHVGERTHAQRAARTNLAAFNINDIDAIITNAAGCGSGMHEYPLILQNTADEQQAKALAEKVCDVTSFLDQLGLVQPLALKNPTTVAYHDACHLLHGQSVAAAPRRLLQQIENLTLVELDDGGRCCGSAGTYNIEQPHNAQQLGQLKAQAVAKTQADAVVTGNIGCMVQIRKHLADTHPIPVLHTAQLLERASNPLPQ